MSSRFFLILGVLLTNGPLLYTLIDGMVGNKMTPSSSRDYDDTDYMGEDWNYQILQDNIHRRNVSKVFIYPEINDIVVTDANYNHSQPSYLNNLHTINSIPYMTNKIIDLLTTHHIEYNIRDIYQYTPRRVGSSSSSSTFPYSLMTLYFYFIIICVLFLFIRHYNAMKRFETVNNNKNDKTYSISHILSSNNVIENKITFADVAGCEEAKFELMEVVEFLKNPQQFVEAGAKIPSGVLLEGPPGTGKTLLAKATAGEANVGFISVSGSEFIEMYVGVGASRIRDLFNKAKKESPCIIFIDEIDAIGRQRSGMSGGHDEHGQTLNQLLTNMDGFSKREGIIVIGATNRIDILDSALTRPGRFDRKITIGLPDKDGRKEILKVHLKDKKIDTDINYSLLYDLTVGFSGAELSNLVNESAIMSVRYKCASITNKCVMDAFEKISIGLPKKHDSREKPILEMISYHECGHAIMAMLFKEYFNVRKITINANNKGAGGYTLYTPLEQYSNFPTKKYILATLMVALGGRAAEIILYRNQKHGVTNYDDGLLFNGIGDLNITTGASNDLQQANHIARNYIHLFGINETIDANMTVSTSASSSNSGYANTNHDRISDNSRMKIDIEIENLVQASLDRAILILENNSGVLSDMVKLLKNKRMLNEEDLVEFNIQYKKPKRQGK